MYLHTSAKLTLLISEIIDILGEDTAQSSMLDQGSFAIDGDLLTSTATSAVANEWWRIDLGSQHVIASLLALWDSTKYNCKNTKGFLSMLF